MANDNSNETPTSAQAQPHGVHLVGSVPLNNAEEVFRTASSTLGDRLRRVPDGETGIRTNWIGWQINFLAQNPHLEVLPCSRASNRRVSSPLIIASRSASPHRWRPLPPSLRRTTAP